MTDPSLPPQQQPNAQQPTQPVYQQQPVQYQPVYQQPVYLQPVYAPGPPRGASIGSFVIGLVSLLLGFTLILPLIGFIIGIVGARREPAGRGFAIAGIVINGLILFGWVIVAAVIIVSIISVGAFTIPFIAYTDSGVYPS